LNSGDETTSRDPIPPLQDNPDTLDRVDRPDPPSPLDDTDDIAAILEDDLAAIEQGFARPFLDYFGLPEPPPRTLQDAQRTLAAVTEAANVQPALVYVRFVPPLVNTEAEVDEQLELILVTPEGEPLRVRVAGVGRSQVFATANTFRNEVTNPTRSRTTRYLAPAQQLYQWLIAPLEAELQAQGIDNLAFVLDEGLRSLPIAALHDGQGFLVERYSVGLMPSLSLVDTEYRNIRQNQVLAMGASQFQTQVALPAVPVELEEIAENLWDGQYFLNADFTLGNLVARRQEQPFGIVHLATHGEFRPGDPSNSYIQFWDQRLGLDQLRQMNLNNPPVNLLVLSACRTALGDAQAELGFAGLALQSGVQTALASLWYVSDAGTLALMTEFYPSLRAAPIRAEALRQAQLALIRGEVQLTDENLISRRQSRTITLPSELTKGTAYNLAHPYYWAGFTMIGSPW